MGEKYDAQILHKIFYYLANSVIPLKDEVYQRTYCTYKCISLNASKGNTASVFTCR